MGRSRKPTAELKLHHGKIYEGQFAGGTREHEPQPEGVPAMPSYVKGSAATYWRKIVPGLVDTGVAKQCDSEALAQLCMWHQQLATLWKVPIVRRNRAWRCEAVAASQRWEVLAMQFGLTPVARTRIEVAPPKRQTELQEMLG